MDRAILRNKICVTMTTGPISGTDRGLRVLLVSTDPASNLDEVLDKALANDPTAIETVVPNL